MKLDREFWNQRYATSDTGWDIGAPSTPLKDYIDQLTNKRIRMLIPGGGRAWEAEYAHRQGFTNVFVIDLSDAPLQDLLERCPDFPREHFVVGDFFGHAGRYDLILEQTFFCAIDPAMRARYVEHMHRLLRPGGRLVGVLFNDPLNTDRPPFGGSLEEYAPLFQRWFPEVTMEPCRNSIAPRAGRELWLRAVKRPALSCALADRLEEAIVRKQPVILVLRNGQRIRTTVEDLFARDGADWLRVPDGTELRADEVAALEQSADPDDRPDLRSSPH